MRAEFFGFVYHVSLVGLIHGRECVLILLHDVLSTT